MQQHHFLSLAEVLEAAKSETFRWTATRKRDVLEAVRDGNLSEADVKKRFGVSAEELASWSRALDKNGVAGLYTKRVQVYEPQRRKPYKAPASRARMQLPAGAFR